MTITAQGSMRFRSGGSVVFSSFVGELGEDPVRNARRDLEENQSVV